ncbi:CBM21 domain-containing protein Ecym_4344 [Eremothecium cymbalariae DBVPG|uniref:CBM21 domain-containing protein n=1 Tax=Eremothecium cymbalariae (strain CBS 270.75 / DBVPG 7215 / KCTC 17166 / NRRL Y-17582) TaxID=931890 RepID=G8JTQ2_ERECY|nr:hypothetical protein Ecym_4344 [Eremothecium cymbalariae DBVPG\
MEDRLELQLKNLNIRARSTQDGKLSSLAFLRKPQRITSQTKKEELENILKRNTDWNRIHTCGKLGLEDLRVNTNNDENLDSQVDEPTYVRSGSPPEPTDYFSRGNAPMDKVGHQRSKSLPGTPTSALKRARSGVRRSKSVHFDTRDVVSVKYFNSDESTLLVSNTQSVEDHIKSRKDQNSNLLHSLSGIDSVVNIGTAASSKKPLRKSKRFKQQQQLQKARTKTPLNVLKNLNFPILSNNNPSVLKLNIFLNVAYDKKVFLQELCMDGNIVITGKVLVKNLHYDKTVLIRYSWDRWCHSSDTESVWIGNGNAVLPGKGMDMFEFAIDIPPQQRGQNVEPIRLEFCIMYQVRDINDFQTHWDNNHGNNYIIECS